MSTYAIGAIVNHGVRHMPADTAYLNVGVWAGFSLLAGMVGNEDRRVIGVDNFSEFVGGTFGDVRGEFAARFEAVRSPLHEFHDIDYREYFASVHRGPVGFYFYDGEHSYENQLLSLELVEPFLVRGAAVMIDDAFAEAPRQALNDFLASRRDAYEIVFERQPVTKGHPTFWNGIAILARR